MPQLICEQRGPVTTLTLNRPERLNALSHQLIDELLDLLEDAAEDETCRVLVLQGSGRAFCAGDDLKGMGDAETRRWRGRTRSILPQQMLIDRLRSLPKPIVARLHGAVLGMGLDMALACDIRICADDATLGDPRAERALYAATGINYQLPRFVGYGRAMEMMLLAERVEGREAVRLGLVYRVVPVNELDAAVATIVDQLARAATKSLAVIKQQLREQLDMSYADAARHSIWMRATHTIEDTAEARLSFLEKRPPDFTGR
jgi:2-(1,2-epoxy-1,2-dihydrophenyl)acetyl-CoA isomerase